MSASLAFYQHRRWISCVSANVWISVENYSKQKSRQITGLNVLYQWKSVLLVSVGGFSCPERNIRAVPGQRHFHPPQPRPSLGWDVCWDERGRRTERSSDGVHHSRHNIIWGKAGRQYLSIALYSFLFQSLSVHITSYLAANPPHHQTIHDIIQVNG